MPLFRLLSWIPGCRPPRYVRYYDEKDSPLIPDIAPVVPHLPHVLPPTRRIPEGRHRRRLIDEDFSLDSKDIFHDTKYQKHPMHEETIEVTAAPVRDTLPQPRGPHREKSQRARDGDLARTNSNNQNNSASRRRIADETLAAIERGEVQLQGSTYNIREAASHSIDNTIFFPPESTLATWSTSTPASRPAVPGQLELCEGSTLQRARALLHELNTNAAITADGPGRVGVLNFASATKPGGGFLSGAQAQEESLARASTLYVSLVTPAASQFHQLHKQDRRGGFYTHSMIFSPSVLVLRDDDGAWVPPYQIEVVTCAGGQRGCRTMRERMARILFLFEQRGLRNIVLGSFGTGVFRNDVGMVADIWFDLLA
ncbi:hypothetical protein EDB85DRAFT_2139299 [Lactarius pseudohatsudake]|nr:hypothetical protein EDB85DRAFT_2139299 [Lactarius pseudohatsudake]